MPISNELAVEVAPAVVGARYPTSTVTDQIVNSGTLGSVQDLGNLLVVPDSEVVQSMTEDIYVRGTDYQIYYAMGTIVFLPGGSCLPDTDYKVSYSYSPQEEYISSSTLYVREASDLILALEATCEAELVYGVKQVLVEVAWSATRDGPYRYIDAVTMAYPVDVVRVPVPEGWIRLAVRNYGEHDFASLKLYATFGPATGPYQRKREISMYDTLLASKVGGFSIDTADTWTFMRSFFLPFAVRFAQLRVVTDLTSPAVRLCALDQTMFDRYPSTGGHLWDYPERALSDQYENPAVYEHVPAGWYCLRFKAASTGQVENAYLSVVEPAGLRK